MPSYAKADLTVDSDADLSVEAMAARVAFTLATRPDVMETD
jgi:hypothetical protein